MAFTDVCPFLLGSLHGHTQPLLPGWPFLSEQARQSPLRVILFSDPHGLAPDVWGLIPGLNAKTQGGPSVSIVPTLDLGQLIVRRLLSGHTALFMKAD
jgi:hypothetical protein